ncbi:MAG: S1/P1 nuclease [Candidatus Marinimicrobia bacterium]|jgi:hypothetical protein|nr:S1/P1 nuclease [Candidatus Neomarinimicrobiota bacterium]|tara:strand:- start:83 stop:838 length:756 start_codon:yes stop_codon:yes gene_type:complete
MKKHFFIFFPLFLSVVFGWGKTGHRIVGYIAEQHLTEDAKRGVSSILGHSSLAMVSTWADEIKSDPDWKYAYDWHWTTIPDGENFETGKRSGKAVEKVQEFLSLLKSGNGTQSENEVALKFLVHLIGDLHQPLHVGNGTDRGGNDVNVKWFGKSTNLHAVWDTDLIDHQKLSYSEYGDYLILGLTEKKRAEWINTDIFGVISESQKWRDQTYKFENDNLKWDYFYQNKELLELRLLQGGVRLAGMLNRIFR